VCSGTWRLELYTLSLHDALPILNRGDRRETWNLDSEFRPCGWQSSWPRSPLASRRRCRSSPRTPAESSGGSSMARADGRCRVRRSEEHTSELQSREKLVCRLLLE